MKQRCYCPYCLREISEKDTKCPECGEWLPLRSNASRTQRSTTAYESSDDSDIKTGCKISGPDIEDALTNPLESTPPPPVHLDRNKNKSSSRPSIFRRFSLLGVAILLLLLLMLCS
ncbi:MAG: hypothetical protein J6C81_05790 [Muribaculaceae bacterium]|nr:hypothetical protein [Muribaculaceae bacterium]